MRMSANTQRTFTHFGFEVSVKIHRDTLSRELDIAILNFREEKEDSVFIW